MPLTDGGIPGLGSVNTGLAIARFAGVDIPGIGDIFGLGGKRGHLEFAVARDASKAAQDVFKKQRGIFEQLDLVGTESDIYKSLGYFQGELSKGDDKQILKLLPQALNAATVAQNIIGEVPDNFRGKLTKQVMGRTVQNKDPVFTQNVLPFARINQFLDLAQTPGSTYSIYDPSKAANPQFRGRGGRGTSNNPYASVSVNQLDIDAIGRRLQGRVAQPGDPDFVGPVQEQPSQPGKVDKGKVAKTVLKAASNFIRVPRQQRGGFVSTSGFGNISELEQEEDRVIPSGFIRKQATTALAPTRRNALDTIV